MTTKTLSATVSALALAAVLAAGALTLPATATAADWGDAVTVTAKVTGSVRTVDSDGDWSRVLRVENARGARRVAAAGPYGFLQQALSYRNGLDADARGLDQLAVR